MAKKQRFNFPKSPTIMGREKYFNCAVLAPLIYEKEKPHLLFQKRASSIRQGSEICFPGGKIDPSLDTNGEATATRETCEELGITKKSIHITGQLDTIIAPMGALIEVFVGEIKIISISELELNKEEVETVFTLPLSYFQKNEPQQYHIRLEVQPHKKEKDGKTKLLLPASELNLPERYSRPWGGHLYPVYAYPTQHGTIWGITAEIIKELTKIVK